MDRSAPGSRGASPQYSPRGAGSQRGSGPAGPRVEPGVDLAEPAELDPRVDLGGGDRGVTQHLLDHAEVGPAGEEVGGEAVAERVRADLRREPGGPGMLLDDRPEPDPRQRADPAGDEDLGDPHPTREQRPAGLASDTRRGPRGPSNRAGRPAPCPPCRCTGPSPPIQVEVGRAEPDHLRGPAARRVEGLQRRAVAAAEGGLGVGRPQELVDRLGTEDRRQPVPDRGGDQKLGDVLRERSRRRSGTDRRSRARPGSDRCCWGRARNGPEVVHVTPSTYRCPDRPEARARVASANG